MIKAIQHHIICLLASAVFSSSVSGASFEISTDPSKSCSAVRISGNLQVGDYNRFVVSLKQANALAPVRRLYLNSAGGDLAQALAITEVIRNTVPMAETIVQSGHSCNSACFIIFTVGSRRNVSADAHLLIHQVLNERTGKRDAEITKNLGQYLALNGMPPDVMWTMGNLGPDEVLAVTPSNAKKLGFGSFNFYGSTNPPATPHCSWDGFTLKQP